MSDYQKLLSYWHKLEHFSPAQLPKGNIVELEDSVPWIIPSNFSDPKKTIEFTVYLGVFESSHVTDFVKAFFKDDSKDENQRTSKICFASLKLDRTGGYINNSLGISTLPWALAQLEKKKINSNDWSIHFENMKNSIINDFDYIFDSAQNEKGDVNSNKVISKHLLEEIQSHIETLCGWSIKPTKKIFVKKEEKFIANKDSAKSDTTTDLLNSFYIQDLETILTGFKKDKSPIAFLNYLDGALNKKSLRTDLSEDIYLLTKSLTPRLYPDGCWPSDHTLSLMQQFAVNTIFNEMSGKDQEGMFSVNGPPGTGKTTLLRDIVAAIVVKRAKAMSKINNPSDAFKRIGKLDIGNNFSPFIYAPSKELTDGGILIASSNNGAVENISKELPQKNEVSPFDEQIGYFRKVAENCIDQKNWGLISAVLGNKQNRNNFVSALWFNQNTQDLRQVLGLKQISNSEWENVVREFNTKLKQVSKEKEKLELFKKQEEEFTETSKQKKQLSSQILTLKKTKTQIISSILLQQELVNKLNAKKESTLNELSIIKQSKPNFFIYWFNKRIRLQYKTSLQTLLKAYNDITLEINQQTKILQEFILTDEEIRISVNNNESKLLKCQQKIDLLEPKTIQARTELSSNYADELFWKKIETKSSQEACPWYSKELKKLQSELFIVSLKLNELFILKANEESSRITTTLSGFFEYLKGGTLAKKEEIKAMWDTFFLVIPVVSSTFASIQTMFKDLSKEDIPWLFIDEAGQAVPQSAAGAIWRSKRVAVVGDPFQIEPVVTIPETLTNNISAYFGLNRDQINSELSVQSIADRINPIGTTLTRSEGNSWIGIPLRIHRRCLSPMFEISNSIAYENTMFSSTSVPNQINVNFESVFIHCNGSVNGRHYVPEQAEIISQMLVNEIYAFQNLPDIFVITPFNEISYKLKTDLYKPIISELRKYQTIDSTIINNWLDEHIGTVHTFQGKQAAGVILCLGLDERTKAAAIWASQKPNLLNVAVTRAKFRFVAVGNKDIWLKHRYFSQLTKLKLV